MCVFEALRKRTHSVICWKDFQYSEAVVLTAIFYEDSQQEQMGQAESRGIQAQASYVPLDPHSPSTLT